jgi:predicted RNA-binding Zn-ribbon protein involved in translation (DUF1610 family)
MIPAEQREYAQRRFLTLTARNENGCLIWQGGSRTKDGYGMFSVGRDNNLAHRAAYELFVGPIPDGLVIDHLCSVRDCVEVQHLEPVTQWENNARSQSISAINLRKTHCDQGHEFTPANTRTTTKGRNCRACDAVRYKTKVKGQTYVCPDCGESRSLQRRAKHARMHDRLRALLNPAERTTP